VEGAETVGLLLSGGLDSSILLAHLLRQTYDVQTFYIRCGLAWEGPELAAARRYLQHVRPRPARSLVILDLWVKDLYGAHWSVLGSGAPGHDTADDAVYLPGRNALLLIKPAIWCQMHGIDALAMAPLKGNPFADASDVFFDLFEKSLERAGGRPIRLVRPFSELTKREVMHLGRDCPLELTFSCIEPIGGRHCGVCNKCEERRQAFRDAGQADPTDYASRPLPKTTGPPAR
jgi:7-cyano-7-deazaguanine synthase